MLALVAAAWVLLLAGCDWNMYRGGPGHAGASFGESTIGVANVGSLGQAWTTSDDLASERTLGTPVVAAGRLYAQHADALVAYDADGLVGCGGTPTECSPVWRTDSALSTPAVVDGTVYGVASVSTPGSADVLRAYDASGITGCDGSTPICQPLWTGLLGDDASIASPPTVADGTVYLSAVTSGTDVLLAFDAGGVQGCAGVPKVCQPIWTASIGTAPASLGGHQRSPSVASGRVFVSGSDRAVHVFDAAGQEGCGGSPTTCGELWAAAVPLICDASMDPLSCGLSTPAVSSGRVYVSAMGTGGTGGLYVFDASGATSCGGSPKVCSPLWRTAGGGSTQAPAVANGVVLAVGGDVGLIAPVRLRAFDASGVQGCSGTPVICAPRWESTTTWFGGVRLLDHFGDPVVANGVVYVSGFTDYQYLGPFVSVIRHVQAFDVAGVQGCTGVPTQCAPRWDLSPPRDVLAYSDPVIADGVLYVGDLDVKAQPSATLARVVRAYRL